MKIMIIECNAEELRANKTIVDKIIDAVSGFADSIIGTTRNQAVIVKSEDEPVLIEEKEAQEVPEKGYAKRGKIDDGKIAALRKAGWSINKIAEEIGCSPQTVCNHISAMAVKEQER